MRFITHGTVVWSGFAGEREKAFALLFFFGLSKEWYALVLLWLLRCFGMSPYPPPAVVPEPFGFTAFARLPF